MTTTTVAVKRAVLAGVVLGLASVGGCARADDMSMPTPSLFDVVDDLRQGSLDRAAIERATGLTLTEDRKSSAFRIYKSEARALADATLEGLDFREPIAGGTATAGPLLNMAIKGQCVAKPDIQARYGPLEISQVPRGRSVNEQMTLSRTEPWGRLSFGFAERQPDCLSSVTFSKTA